MKLSLTLLASCVAFLPAVSANFDIYMVAAAGTHGHETKSWQIFPTEPSCDEVQNTGYWTDERDVSGTRTGIRCEGSGCDYKPSPDDIEILEMNFHGSGPVYHWSTA